MINLDELSFIGLRRLPIVQSSEAAECGLACLCMVARYHGHNVDLNSLRQRFHLSLSGVTLRGIMKFADELELAPRALRIEMSALSKVQTPAIVHWNFNHFVVLKSVKADCVVVHDPALGARSISIGEFSNHFTGIVLELTPTPSFRPIIEKSPIKLNDLWSNLKGFWTTFFQILILTIALQVVVLALPFQMQLVVDNAIYRSDNELIKVIALGFGCLIIIHSVIEALRAWILQVFGQMLSFQVIGNIIRHMMRLPSDWFEKRHVGSIISRIGSAEAIQDILTRGVITALIDGIMAAISAIILFIYSPLLASVVLGGVFLNFILAAVCFPSHKLRTEEHLIEKAREQSHIMETVRAAVTIKLMGRQFERESSWRNLFARVINAQISVSRIQIGLNTAQSAITGLQTVLVIYIGASTIIAGNGFSVGMLFAFLAFRQTFTDRSNALINQFIQFRFLDLHLERLADIVRATPENLHSIGSAISSVRGGIEFKKVSFSYGSTDRPVLNEVCLAIEPGEFVAITGRSGSGKTTLLKLMMGLRQPTSGTITLDGLIATEQAWQSWREYVGVVSQDDRLLSGTIADNISFFDSEMDIDLVHQASRNAHIHEEIMQMPMQYMSLVGDMGSTLSGGQKQRVLLARALYRKPKILILDEGTANLDMETEEKISDLICSLNITRIVVAHRPALLRKADRIIVVNNGEIL